MPAVFSRRALSVVVWATGLALCGAIAAGWIDELSGFDLESLRSWWFYLAIGLTAVVGGGWFAEAMERVAFERHRKRLLREIERAGFEPLELL